MLVNCVAYENGVRLCDLTVEAISDYLERPGCLVWVALCDPTPEELDRMQDEFGLHELAVEDARVGHQRPKIEEYGDSLFVVMHQIENGGADFHASEFNVFVGPNYVLSVRHQSRQHFLSVRERCEREPELLKQGSGFVFYALMDAVVDRYFPVLDGLEDELEAIEEQLFAKGAAQDNIRRLYDLKRRITVVKHAVAPLLEAETKLIAARGPAICAGTREYFRDVHDHLTRINASIESIRESIGMAVQANISMVAIEEGVVNKQLAAWAGIFAVATAFAGIWGMNFKAMPELQWEYGYPMALLIISVTCVFLYTRFKRSGWL